MSSDDALDHAEISTEKLAEQENDQAAKEDKDKAYERSDRYYKGQRHDRYLGDR
ncbi:MAG: hypothetical protein WBQ14_02180 [Gaiellaceae bacterium]